jgi:hypothetical protein
VGDKHVALLLRELVERGVQLVQQEAPRVRRIGARIRRRQQILEQRFRRLAAGGRRVQSHGRLPPAIEVGDAVPGDAKQPRARVFDRPGQAHGLDELAEHVLQDVLCVIDVRNPGADEATEAALFSSDRVGEPVVPEHLDRYSLSHLLL